MKTIHCILIIFIFSTTAVKSQEIDTCNIFSSLRQEYEEYLCDDSTETVEFIEENYEIALLQLKIKYIEGYKHYTDTIMLRKSVGWYPPHYVAYYYTEKCKEYEYYDFIGWVTRKYCHK